MHAGFGLLRLAPAGFWAMTPIELRHAMGWTPAGDGAPTRTALDALMQRFPDEGTGETWTKTSR